MRAKEILWEIDKSSLHFISTIFLNLSFDFLFELIGFHQYVLPYLEHDNFLRERIGKIL